MQKTGPAKRPKIGDCVLLKSLSEICAMIGVDSWEEIYHPNIDIDMIHLFGKKIEVVGLSRTGDNFKAIDPKTKRTWFFNPRWIEDDGYNTEGLSDDLFEI